MARILVYAEFHDGAIHDVSLQCLARARQVAAAGDQVVCFGAGAGISSAASALFGFGADEVHVAEHDALKEYLAGPFAAAVRAFAAQDKFPLMLFPATTCGNDLAPLLAASLDAACVLDGIDLRAEGGKHVVSRAEFDRKVRTDYTANGDRPLVASLKDGVAQVGAPDASRSGAVKPFAFTPAGSKSRMVRRDVAKKTVNLKDARIIVGAGAGIGSRDHFAKVQELATALGAQIGATRAVVDAGWLPADHQIGQTGATVRPDVYVACGVSGAVQHWVGMSESKTIVAINTDGNAPIMKRAHYRITGDVNAVLPKLIKVLKS